MELSAVVKGSWSVQVGQQFGHVDLVGGSKGHASDDHHDCCDAGKHERQFGDADDGAAGQGSELARWLGAQFYGGLPLSVECGRFLRQPLIRREVIGCGQYCQRGLEYPADRLRDRLP